MAVRQFFDHTSFTYTYLVIDDKTGEAALIDPVKEQLGEYLRCLRELELSLKIAIDTHIHADHITALGDLRERTGCKTLVGNTAQVACATEGLGDGVKIAVGGLQLVTLFTPGHTDDSYCFSLQDGQQRMLLTGDTLLIRGCGRTDFQQGDPAKLYHSLHHILLEFPDETVVYPGHDYRGWTQSTIGEERRHNPRLLLESEQAFVDFMNNLKLPNPKMMDLSVPANLGCGKVKGDQ